jgi:hypothetical protein
MVNLTSRTELASCAKELDAERLGRFAERGFYRSEGEARRGADGGDMRYGSAVAVQ